MDSPDAAVLVGLLADEDRLRAVAAVVLGAKTPDQVAEASGLDSKRVLRALERLAGGGLIQRDEGDGTLLMAVQHFRDAAEARPQPEPDLGDATPEQAEVLRHFVEGRRLTSIPASHAKRMVVLDWLSQRFEPGQIYPERDVNLMLGMVHADFAALRRYLVDEAFLERRDGFYWRAGGTFAIE